MKTNKKINFQTPIQEFSKTTNDFLIRGIAINETTTRNGVKYIAKELEKSAHTLRNKPILKDHNNSVESIVGKTTNNVYYDTNTKNIKFEAKITNKEMQEMINEELITSVSIGAMVHELEESTEDGSRIAKGIDFVELSLVAVPADPNAGFTKAIAESFEIKEEIEGGEIKMAEENKLNEKPAEEPIKEPIIEPLPEEPKEEKAELKEINSLKEELKKFKEEIETLKKVKIEEQKKVDETKGEIMTEENTKTEKETLKFERSESGKGFAFFAENPTTLHKKYERVKKYEWE